MGYQGLLTFREQDLQEFKRHFEILKVLSLCGFF